MLAGFKRFRPSGSAWRKVGLAGFVVGVATLAFFWGRHGATHAVAQGPQGARGGPFPGSKSDYDRRIVAYIHGNIPITREDLGEYLIARFGAQRVEYLVNRRIIELACQARGITVSDAEVDAEMRDQIASFKGTIPDEKTFVESVLKRYNKTLYEWREDVIRPKLALAKFCRDQIRVFDEDIQHAFEARYGERIKCRMIVLSQQLGHKAHEIWAAVKASDAEFDKVASAQFIPQLAATKGEIPEIHKHFGDLPSEKKIEEAAFALRTPGEVSALLAMPDKTFIILKLVERLPPNTAVKLSEVRAGLHKDVFESKLAKAIPLVFQELRQRAQPNILLPREAKPGELDRQVERPLNISQQVAPGAPAGH